MWVGTTIRAINNSFFYYSPPLRSSSSPKTCPCGQLIRVAIYNPPREQNKGITVTWAAQKQPVKNHCYYYRIIIIPNQPTREGWRVRMIVRRANRQTLPPPPRSPLFWRKTTISIPTSNIYIPFLQTNAPAALPSKQLFLLHCYLDCIIIIIAQHICLCLLVISD